MFPSPLQVSLVSAPPSFASTFHDRLSSVKSRLEQELEVSVKPPDLMLLKFSIEKCAVVEIFSFVGRDAEEARRQVGHVSWCADIRLIFFSKVVR